MAVMVVGRVRGKRAIYGVLVDTLRHPGRGRGVVGPLADAASRRRFLAGELPTDPDRAAWGQRQRWAFPSLGMRPAPVVGTPLGATAPARQALPKTASYRHEYVRCGKATCTRGSADLGHGPYLYAYWRAERRARRRDP